MSNRERYPYMIYQVESTRSAAPAIIILRLALPLAILSFIAPIVAGQTDKRFGEACVKLTQKAKCEVCSASPGGNWVCTSYVLWEELPGSRMPVPDSPPNVSPRRSGASAADATALGIGGCDRYWAPEFDQTRDPAIQERLRQHQLIDQIFTQMGGPQQVIAYVQTPGNLERDFGQLASLKNQGMTVGQSTSGEYKLVADGFVRIAKCREGTGLSGLSPNQTVADAISVLMSNTPVTPISSQSDLSSFDQQAQANEVAGDNSDPKLALSDEVAAIDQGKEASPTKGDEDLNALASKAENSSGDKPAGCDELISYRDNELEDEFNVAIAQRDIFIDGEAQQFDLAKDTLNLMNDHWWRSERIAKVAIEVKFVTDEVNAFLSFYAPEAKATDPKWVKLLGQPQDIVGHAGTAIGIIRSDVENGARKASEDGSKDAVWTLADALNPLIAMSHGVVEHAENEEGLEKYQEEVQKQVAAIVRTARNMHDKAKEKQSKADSIAIIRQDITDYCSAQPVINLIPK